MWAGCPIGMAAMGRGRLGNILVDAIDGRSRVTYHLQWYLFVTRAPIARAQPQDLGCEWKLRLPRERADGRASSTCPDGPHQVRSAVHTRSRRPRLARVSHAI